MSGAFLRRRDRTARPPRVVHYSAAVNTLIDIEKEDWAKSMHRLLERAHRATRFARENGRDVPTSLVARISRAWARILDHAIRLPRGAAASPDRQARTKETPHRS